MKLMDMELLHSMTPGVLPDRELRETLEAGWTVVLVEHGTMARAKATITTVHPGVGYSAELLPSLTPVYFEAKHVLSIIGSAAMANRD